MVGVINRENFVSWITGSIEGDCEVKISEKEYGIPPGGTLRVDLRRDVDGIPQRWWVGRPEVVRRYLESGRQDLGQTRVIWDPSLKATRV